jgi:Tfp pilus assembly protein PilV
MLLGLASLVVMACALAGLATVLVKGQQSSTDAEKTRIASMMAAKGLKDVDVRLDMVTRDTREYVASGTNPFGNTERHHVTINSSTGLSDVDVL